MPHKLTKSDCEFIRSQFRHRSNRQLAEDLEVEKKDIQDALDLMNLKRTREEDIYLKNINPALISVPSAEKLLDQAPVPFKFHQIAVFLIFGIVFFLYSTSFANKFVWDDEILVVQNNYIKSWNHLPDFFTQNTFKGGDRDSEFWRPVQLFSELIDYSIYGLNPIGFHLSNTLYHALVSILVYILIFLLFEKKSLALLTALLYSAHPIHTEAVTYISGRADSQCAFFILLSLCLYVRYTRSTDSRDILMYFGSFLSFILALMSKEMAFMLPAYMLLIDVSTYERQTRKSWLNIILRYLPMLSVLSIYITLRITVLDFADTPLLQNQAANQVNTFLRFITFTRSLLGALWNPAVNNLDLGYVWLLLFPFNLHMERGMPYAKTLFTAQQLIPFLGFTALVALTVYLFKKSKPLFFGLAFFIVAFIPFMDLRPLNANVAEHWLYIPSIGLLLVLADLICKKLKLRQHHSTRDIFKRLLFSPVIIYLIYCGILTLIRNFDWKDELTIWKETARLSNSSHIHGNLGVAYGRKRDYASAKLEFIKAIHLQFNYPEAHNNLGVLLLMEGKLDEAKKEFEYAIQFNPNYSNAYKNLGDVYAKKGNKPEAETLWQKALEINPYHKEAQDRLHNL